MRTNGLHDEGVNRFDVSRHDCLLFALPLPLLVGAVWGTVTGVSLAVAVGAGSLLALATLAYGLFVDPPVGRGVVDAPARDGRASGSSRDRTGARSASSAPADD